ncbi:hypothetical protein cyc_03446 [Cyclospora cayetanensis]|uniref:Uncharacterized protein n=1 Tax=Cyclospora cayetanensis TaxID=88456 RepID=A0A1D3D2W0_9EIME|nr:hypothetical protein cyc_03446 [Cyclospora cayetanensis]
MARARKIFEDLEIKHEACIIDLALTYEYYLSSPEPPPADAPARCLAAGAFIHAAQCKLHQVNCHFLQPRDKVTMGMAEWTLEEAQEDLRIANAKLKTLPRRMRSGRRRNRRVPPLVTLIRPPGCGTPEGHPCCSYTGTHQGPCRDLCTADTYARHPWLSSNLSIAYPAHLTRSPAPSLSPAPHLAEKTAMMHSVEVPQAHTLPQYLDGSALMPTHLIQSPRVLTASGPLQSAPVALCGALDLRIRSTDSGM